jgi:putative nucleotidyltransferase with HDIG domain
MMPPEDNAFKLHFDRVIDQINDLPALPSIVQDLAKSHGNSEDDINYFTQQISLDQALSAKTLRFANSSFYGLQTKITTIRQAITLIGIDAVRHVITATSLTTYFPANGCAGFDFMALWRHAVATAVCARALARQLHLNQDYAFTAGLLHDIGRLVLATHFRSEYEQVMLHRNRCDCQLLDAEHAILGIDHAMVGAELAAHWNFSHTIQHAILYHHAPEQHKDHALPSLINVANAIVHALDLSGQQDDLVPPVSDMAWHGMGLDEAAYQLVFQDTELMFEEVSQVLLA